MDTIFPFGVPEETGRYFVLYFVTLILHVVFMNYVLAGTGFLAVASLVRSGREGRTYASVAILRDWMPFALGAAITAGVAPLLFVQILYKRQFYSANLLLFHRWMIMVPVLMIGFYLLYLMKSRWFGRSASKTQAMIACGAWACFLFAGWSWTENHVLSLDERAWPGHFAAGAMTYSSAVIAPRFLVWCAGAIPTMCTMLGWQIRGYGFAADGAGEREARRLAVLALAGLLLCAGFGAWYFTLMGEEEHAVVSGAALRPCLLLAAAGLVGQGIGWVLTLRTGRSSAVAITLTSVALLVTFVGATAVREAIRTVHVDMEVLVNAHVRVARSGGWYVFLFFLALNAAIIAWCIRGVRSGISPGTADSPN